MSNRKRIVELLDTIPEYKMHYVLAYIQGVAAVNEEKPVTPDGNAHE